MDVAHRLESRLPALRREELSAGIARQIPGESLAIAAFRTRQVGDSLDFSRTVGMMARSGTGRPSLLLERACALACHSAPAASARGKVALWWPSGDRDVAACYQVSDDAGLARLSACGNATTAIAAWRLVHYNRALDSFDLELPGDVTLQVDATTQGGRVEVLRDTPEGLVESTSVTVRQTWRTTPLAVVQSLDISGHECVACASPLNDYVIVRLKPGESSAAFTLQQAMAIWKGFGFERDSLSSRLAVVEQAEGAAPRVRFFTCGGREHPSAPLTGLAVLALVDQVLDWGCVSRHESVVTPTGPMSLPQIRAARRREHQITAHVEFPPTIVDLTERRGSFAFEGESCDTTDTI